VHFLGEIGAGVINHHGLRRAGGSDAKARISQRCGQLLAEQVVGLKEVDKAGAGDLGLADAVIRGQGGNQFFCQLARLFLRRLGQHHGQIGGEVAVAAIFGAVDLHVDVDVHGQGAIRFQRGDGLFE